MLARHGHRRLDDLPARRLIVIGDVHGCLDELTTLYTSLAPTPQDLVVLAGDLVAKGPCSAEVLQFVRRHHIRAVLGNHDAHWLHYWRTQDPRTLSSVARHQAEQLQAEDWAYLDALPLSLHLPRLNTLIVHAGVLPGVPLSAQQPQHLLNMRSILPDGSVAFRAAEGRPWVESWYGPAFVVFGHDAVRGLQHTPYALGLDTGCVYGHRLSAVVLPEQRLVTVEARRAYAAPESFS